MIFVTQGHECGIGLEVFFKALQRGPRAWWGRVELHAHRATVAKHIRALKLTADVTADGISFLQGTLRCSWVRPGRLPSSTLCMESALEARESMGSGGVLFTLPTTKDDLRDPRAPRRRFLGHTEYLRARFRAPHLSMFFTADDLHMLLLTDHVALKDVPKAITPKVFEDKLGPALASLRVLEPSIRRTLVSGINPHAGEGGLLGKEELRLAPALKRLQKRFRIEGFFPADTIYRERRSESDLLVYTHHDQGLALFKALKGTLGANITLGLPFLRLSVDHGTAFPLYGKNIADPSGATYCLRKAMVYRERLIGKNPRL